jgi:hypothetical protein
MDLAIRRYPIRRAASTRETPPMNFVPLPTSAGPRRAAPPPPLRDVRLTPEEARLFARFLQGMAKEAEASGNFAAADRLATRAAAVWP